MTGTDSAGHDSTLVQRMPDRFSTSSISIWTAFRSGPERPRGTTTRALLKSRSAASAEEHVKKRMERHSFFTVFAGT